MSIPKGGITDGSVNVETSVVFLNGNDDSAKAYKTAVTGTNASSVYGSYAAVVDPYTISTDTTSNPGNGAHEPGTLFAESMSTTEACICSALQYRINVYCSTAGVL